MNHEGYKDPTAEKAIENASKTPDYVMDVIYVMRDIARLAGFEIVGRVHLRDRTTGKEYK